MKKRIVIQINKLFIKEYAENPEKSRRILKNNHK
jgi:hypothetical protein